MSFVPSPQSGQTPDRINPEIGIRTTQIIWGALLMGVLTFGGLAISMAQPNVASPLPLIGAVFALMATGTRFVVPPIVVRTAIQKIPVVDETIDDRLFPIYQTRLIVGMALLEGACFMNLIAYMTTAQWWTIVVLGILLSLMVVMFPSLPQFRNWAEDQKRDLQNRFH